MYNQSAIRFTYVDDSGTQIVEFSSDEYLRAYKSQDMPILKQTSQKNVVTQYLPTTLYSFNFTLQFKIKSRETYAKIESVIGKKVDIFPYYGDVGTSIDLVEINYTELDYFDKNSFTGIVKPSLTTETFKSMKVRNGIVELSFEGFYRQVPAGIKDIILTPRKIDFEFYNPTLSLSGITRGVSPDDQYTARATVTSDHEYETVDHVDITGATPSGFNVMNEQVLSTPNTTTFTFAVANSVSTPATVAGSVKRRGRIMSVQSSARLVVYDISGGIYPVSLFLRGYYNGGLPGDLIFSSPTEWMSNQYLVHIPYKYTTLESNVDQNGFYLGALDIDATFDPGTNDPLTWYQVATGSFSPSEYADFLTYLNELGIP